VGATDAGGNATVDSMMCTVAGITNPSASVAETSHDFQSVPLDTTVTWDIRVLNGGVDPLSVREVTSTTPEFRVNRTHFFVPPGAEVPITVSFTPTAVQAYDGTIRIRTNDMLHPQINVAVQGRGLDPASAEEVVGGVRFGLRGTRALPSGLEVAYALDRSTDVTFEVFDASGRRLRGAEVRGQAPGVHSWTWNGADETGREMPDGVYFIRMRAGARVSSGSAAMVR
jgi:hypothetical protein